MKEVCDAYDKQSAEIVRRWQALPAARWDGALDFFGSQRPASQMAGAFCSTSCTTVARSRRICARWDQRCRRCTAQVRTSPEKGVGKSSDVTPRKRLRPLCKNGEARLMRKAIAGVILLGQFGVGVSAAPLAERDRQRLIAHLNMTASWLTDEVSGLSPGQLAFRRAPGGVDDPGGDRSPSRRPPIYWQDLQTALKAPAGRKTTMSDADVLWYGIDRTNRERAIPSEVPKGLADLRGGLDAHRKLQARLLEYVRPLKTTFGATTWNGKAATRTSGRCSFPHTNSGISFRFVR